MYNLKIITASTRPGRKGPALADWIFEAAKKHTEFSVELLDLAIINLPFLDEPEHPRFQKYTKEHTKSWSTKIASADAFIFVTPEYNFGYPAPLKNAIDFLHNEWQYKPVAFVSYGGIAGGTRSMQALKQVITALNMVPVVEAVNVPFFTKYIDEQNKFNADEGINKAAEGMFKELLKWTESLQQMRNKK
ncbi:MAG: NADPH-dependent reductase [Chitinophagaceae bacterium]|nr:NADPH-dependent reductase [Chitinophagaceae bacterium]MDB5223557.1 NADPH-dependent reductase [Chitinophagaceae bacterium]